MKRRSFKENLVVVLVVKRLYSSSIRLPNAQLAKIQTNRKQGFRLTSIPLLSPFNEKCFCFKTFFMF